MPAWLLHILIFCGITLALAAIAFLQTRRREGSGACCGYCGYDTTGLPSSVCPECGRDLELVGTRRPTRWYRLLPSTRTAIVLHWLLAALILVLSLRAKKYWVTLLIIIQTAIMVGFEEAVREMKRLVV